MIITDRNIQQWDKLVYKIANKYKNAISTRNDLDIEDLAQMGRLGVYRAINNYNSTKGSFKSYVSNCISYSIARELRPYCNLLENNVEYQDNIAAKDNIEQIDSEIDFDREIRRLDVDPVVKQILTMRFNGYTCKEIGDTIGYTRQAIHKIIFKYKDKLMLSK